MATGGVQATELSWVHQRQYWCWSSGKQFGLLRELAGVVSWMTALRCRKAQGSSLIFKENLLKAWEQPILMSGKRSRRGRRLTWLNVESLTELKRKKKVNRRWKWWRATQEDYGNLAQTAGPRKAEAQVQLKLARDGMANKKSSPIGTSAAKDHGKCGSLLNMLTEIPAKGTEEGWGSQRLNFFCLSLYWQGLLLGCPGPCS